MNAKASLEFAEAEFNRMQSLRGSEGDLAERVRSAPHPARGGAPELPGGAEHGGPVVPLARGGSGEGLARAQGSERHGRAAPLNGLVAERLVSVGDYVTRGQKVATVVRVDPMRVELTVPEQQVAMIKVGQQVRLTVDAYPGEEFAATVRFISPSLRSDQRALTVEAIASNGDGRLKPGLFATALVRQPDAAPALLVPAGAVETVAGTSRVYIVKDNVVDERIVTTGEKVDGHVEITSGVAKGEMVAAEPKGRLTDGAAGQEPLTSSLVKMYQRITSCSGLLQSPCAVRSSRRVLTLSLTVIGAFAFTQLGLDRFPKVDFPTVVVTTRFPGAAPEEVETEVTDQIEEAVNTISGIDELRSNSSEGVSQVIVAFLLEKDGDVAAQEVRDRVNRVLPLLPRTIEQPTVEKFDPDAAPVLTLAVSAKAPIRDITEYADKTLRRQLESVSGVGQVVVVGGRSRQINILLDADRLRAYNLTVTDVSRAIQIAERRDSRRPRRAGRDGDDAAHARPGRRGRRVRRPRSSSATKATRSCCATSPRSKTAWPNRRRRQTSTASRASC